jgi:outer membrane immunogenic protein
MYKRVLIAMAALALATGSAFAAKKKQPPPDPPPPPAPVSSWTGFYIGGNVGYGWTNDFQSSFADPFKAIPFATTTLNAGGASGALGGIQLGWNWQFAPTWLVGIEGDFDWADLHKTGTVAPLFTPAFAGPFPASSFNAGEDIRDLASIRGRVGYVWDSWLAYFTGGGAWIDRNLSANTGCVPAAGGCAVAANAPVNFNQTEWGWVLGSGLEYKAANSPWILGIEYLYYHFADGAAASSPVVTAARLFPLGGCLTPSQQCFFYTFNDNTVQTVRARLSYKF